MHEHQYERASMSLQSEERIVDTLGDKTEQQILDVAVNELRRIRDQ